MLPFLNSTVNKKSNSSRIMKVLLEELNIEFEEEKKISCFNNKYYFVDFYLPEYNIIIEYYGDYWHSNPKVYDINYYNSKCKMFSHEIWEKNKKRLSDIKSEINGSILVIWESSNKYSLSNDIKSLIKKNKIKYV